MGTSGYIFSNVEFGAAGNFQKLSPPCLEIIANRSNGAGAAILGIHLILGSQKTNSSTALNQQLLEHALADQVE